MIRKTIIYLVILVGLIFLFFNAYHYPVNAGYDFKLHSTYAKIISHEWRIPVFEETRENYNPPLFYLTSGLIGRLSSYITGQDFITALKAWQYFSVILASLSIYFWFLIIKKLHPKNKPLQVSFLVLLFSLPVFHKTIVMFSIETWFLFTTSLSFWFLINHFLNKPNLKNTFILSLLVVVNLLTRMSAIVLLITVLAAFIGLIIQKKLHLKKAILLTGLLISIILTSTGWFYLGRDSKEIFGVGEGGAPDIPFFKRQPISFYLDVPFKYMMTHPIRHEIPINKLIPIYYSEFWGDWWNYYSQRRFNISVEARKKDHYLTSPERVSNLALQNQVNLLSAFLLVSGFIYLLIKATSLTFKNKKSSNWLPQSLFIAFTLFTWLGFLSLLTKYPSWKGDSIKASYMLYNLPIFTYFLVFFLFKCLKKYKLIFIPAITWLSISSIINLIWSWY